MKAHTMIRSSLSAVVLFAASVAYASPAAAKKDIAHVDLQRVIDDSQEGQAANARASAYADGITKRVDAAFADAAKAKGTKDEKRKLDEANAADSQGAAMIKQAQNKEKKKLVDRVSEISGKLAKEKHYKNVDNQSFLYSEDDLTADVIARLDAETIANAEAAKAKADAVKAKAEADKAKADDDKTKAENEELKKKLAAAEKK